MTAKNSPLFSAITTAVSALAATFAGFMINIFFLAIAIFIGEQIS